MSALSKTPPDSRMYNGFVIPDRNSYAARCKKKTEMVLRGRVESGFSDNLVFITLTYDKHNLPKTYTQVLDLPIFKPRETRKKYTMLKPRLVPVPCENTVYYSDDDYSDAYCGHVWKTVKSCPLNLKENKYRRFEVMDKSDFNNARHKWLVENSDYTLASKKGDDYISGLLVPKHLSYFLESLRDAIRNYYVDDSLCLRYLANGEYGQTEGATKRPHYHILIFNHFPEFDFDAFVRENWKRAKIYQCDVVPLGDAAVRRITSYVYAHTVKKDDGNQYQNEMSPSFRLMSTYGGGIGYQLTNPKLMQQCKDNLSRSLCFSLSLWSKNESIKFSTRDDKGNLYEYELPRYFKDRVLCYRNCDIRQKTEAMCRAARDLIEMFCRENMLFDNFDLLTLFHYLGFCASPVDVFIYFYIGNYKKLQKKFGDIYNFINFATLFLKKLRIADDGRREVYKERYQNRKQQKKYNDYVSKRGFDKL